MFRWSTNEFRYNFYKRDKLDIIMIEIIDIFTSEDMENTAALESRMLFRMNQQTTLADTVHLNTSKKQSNRTLTGLWKPENLRK